MNGHDPTNRRTRDSARDRLGCGPGGPGGASYFGASRSGSSVASEPDSEWSGERSRCGRTGADLPPSTGIGLLDWVQCGGGGVGIDSGRASRLFGPRAERAT